MISSFGLSDYQTLASKKDLLIWCNSFSSQPITTIQQLGSGVAYCKLISALKPNSLHRQKIKDNAKTEQEFIYNFKLLQRAFEIEGVQKIIEVNRVVKQKYQDNLEFAQWMKRFCVINFGGQVEKLFIKNNKVIGSCTKNKKDEKLEEKLDEKNSGISRSIDYTQEQQTQAQEELQTQAKEESQIILKIEQVNKNDTVNKEDDTVNKEEDTVSYHYILNEVRAISGLLKRVKVKDDKSQGVTSILELVNQILTKISDLEAVD